MKSKFCTYITTYSGTQLPPFYIGATSTDKILSGKYFGSVGSKKWKDIFKIELKTNKHLFSTKILSYHDSRKEALLEELRLHKFFNVVKSELFFNEAFADSSGFYVKPGPTSPNYGKTFTEEHRQKLSISHKGIKHSKETINKLKIAHRGHLHSNNTKNKIRKNQPKSKKIFNVISMD